MKWQEIQVEMSGWHFPMFSDKLKKYSKLLFLKVYFRVYVYVCVCPCEYRCLWNSEKGIGTCRAELTSDCEPHNMGAESRFVNAVYT